MKKLLICSTAIVAAGMIVSPASAADKIKLGLGGFMDQWVGFANNSSTYNNAQAGLPNIGGFDVKSDSEVHVLGSTKLDNGLTVSVKWEMETDTGAQTANTDKSSVSVASATMGTITIGNDANAAYALHHTSPNVGLALDDGDFSNWVSAPSAVSAATPNTATNPGGDASGISYVSPAFSGFSVAATYKPDTTDESAQNMKNGNDAWSAALLYDGKFGGVSVGADLFYGVLNDSTAAGTQTAAYDEAGIGVSLGFGAFVVGGAYKNIDQVAYTGTSSLDGNAWTIGASYTTGPMAFSLDYLKGEAKGDIATAADDSTAVVQLSGSYDLGGGIALAGSVLHVDFDDETSTAGNDNKAWAALAGVRVSF